MDDVSVVKSVHFRTETDSFSKIVKYEMYLSNSSTETHWCELAAGMPRRTELRPLLKEADMGLLEVVMLFVKQDSLRDSVKLEVK